MNRIEEAQAQLQKLSTDLVEALAASRNAHAAAAVADDRIAQITRAIDRLTGLLAGLTERAAASPAADRPAGSTP